MKKGLLKNWIQWGVASLVSLGLIACSGERGDEGSHDHSHGHAHHAPHGGALTMLGNHAYQLELLTKPEAKQVELYVLDGGAEHFVRLANEGFEGIAEAGGQKWELRFVAVASEATGETVGDSSYFVAESEAVSKLVEFELKFERLDIRGMVFESVVLPYPEGAH